MTDLARCSEWNLLSVSRKAGFLLAALTMLRPAQSNASEPVTIQGGGLRVAVDPDTGSIVAVEDAGAGRPLAKGKGGISFFDGAAEKEVVLSKPEKVKAAADSLSVSQAESRGSLRAATEYRGLRDRLLVRVNLANSGQAQRWIEAQLGLPMDYALGQFKYWDGYDEAVPVTVVSNLLPINADPVVRHAPAVFEWGKPGHSPGVEAAYVFPANCVYDDRSGVALGIAVDQTLSYHATGVQPAIGPERAFYCSTKVVLDPGQTGTVSFVAFRFPPEFGWRNCLETFYDLYPDHYRLRPDVDQRITGPMGGAWSAHEGTLIAEQQRRLGRRWIWYYAPFQTCGLTFPDREDWDPTCLNSAGRYNLSYDRWLHSVADATEVMHEFEAVGFYVFNWEADYYAAMRYFPKAMASYFRGNTKPPGLEERSRPNVFGPGVEGLVGVWPLEPTLFQRTIGYYRKIAEVFKPDGIAFDNCLGAAPNYFDDHTRGCPGRWFTKFFSSGHVFSDQKVHLCVRQGVSVKVLGDEVHKLENREGQTMFLAANTPSDYLACGVTDVAIEEHANGPHFIKDSPFWGLGLRKMMGSKPICFTMGHAGETFDRHDYNLFCLHIGATRITPWDREGQEMVPLHWTLARAGWRPVPAMTCQADLLLSRFGRGLGTYLVAINRGDQDVSATLRVRNTYLGPGQYLFSGYSGSEATNRLAGADTEVPITVPKKGYKVLQAVARVERATASAIEIAASHTNSSIELRGVMGGSVGPTIVSLPEGARLREARNGEVVVPAKQTNCEVALPEAGPPLTVVSYRPQVVFLLTDEELAAFPFYIKDKPAASVVFSNKRIVPKREESEVAMKLAAFFAYHLAYAKSKSTRSWDLLQAAPTAWIQARMLEWMQPSEAAIVVSEDAGLPIAEEVSNLVRLGRGVVAAGKMPDGRQVLYVTGPDPASVRAAVDELLVRLERLYPAFPWEMSAPSR